MVLVSALVSALLLSPLVFLLLAGAGAWLLAVKRRRAGLVLAAAGVLLPVLLSVGPVCDLFLRPLERGYPPFPPDAPAVDAVVVLGGGVIAGAPDEGGASRLSNESQARLAYGLFLHKRTSAPLVVSGGRVWRSSSADPEATVAVRFLVRLGVPQSLVTAEERSRNTWENAREVARILGQRRMARVALVTSAYHMPRAMLAFSKAGVACVPAPTDYKSSGGSLTVGDVLPSFEALATSFRALREYLGLLQYLLKAD